MNINPKNKIIIFIITSMIMLLIGMYTYDNNEINTKDVELIDKNVNIETIDKILKQIPADKKASFDCEIVQSFYCKTYV